ncbi:MAG: hypothetical protein KAS63_09895 [Candidatus Heimdallarchaeota archaeon]|nr:hypothetical protein [Candidatus Heimdallarchaeota archaeon]MCK4955663.1 hypothetical protein [Candidatus Heimdallarchaeota archaeon]
MSESPKHVLPLREVSAQKSKFHVIKPSKKTWALLVFIFFGCYIVWYLIIRFLDFPDVNLRSSDYSILAIILVTISLVSPIIAIFLWKWVGRLVTRKLVYNTLKIQNEHMHEIKKIFSKLKKDEHYKKYSFFRAFFASLFNFDISPEANYYLEEETHNLDVSKISMFVKSRLFDMITSSLGIGFLLASIVKFSINNTYVGFLSGSLLLLISPILISGVTPVLWLIKDSRIKYIKPENNSFELSDKFRRSIISRFFSITAIFAGVSFFIDIIQLITGAYEPGLETSIYMYLGAFAAIIIVIILISGVSFAVGMIYLSTFHEKNVNELREELSEFIQFSQTNVVISKFYFT